MTFPVISLIILASLAVALSLYRNMQAKRRPEEVDKCPGSAEKCCGRHEVCERAQLISSSKKQSIDYYDDEELDKFTKRSPSEYTPEETEEFSEILRTMRKEEVSGWLSSLHMRNIRLPESVEEEAQAIINGQKPQS